MRLCGGSWKGRSAECQQGFQCRQKRQVPGKTPEFAGLCPLVPVPETMRTSPDTYGGSWARRQGRELNGLAPNRVPFPVLQLGRSAFHLRRTSHNLPFEGNEGMRVIPIRL